MTVHLKCYKLKRKSISPALFRKKLEERVRERERAQKNLNFASLIAGENFKTLYYTAQRKH